MAYTQAHRRANAQWDRENMVSLSTRVPKDLAESFKAKVAVRNKTVHTVLGTYVRDYIVSDGLPRVPNVDDLRLVKLLPGVYEELTALAGKRGVEPGVLASAILQKYLGEEER